MNDNMNDNMNDKIDDNIITIDILWILQGFRFSFSGFLVEFLGYSSGLKKIFPFLRMTQSSYYNNSDDLPVKNLTLFFTDEMFPKEGNNGAWLYSKEQIEILNDYQFNIKSTFWQSKNQNPNNNNNKSLCLSALLNESNKDNIIYNNDSIIENGIYYNGDNMARSFVRNANNPYECCIACLNQPVCLGWSYVHNNSINTNHLYQVSSINGCHLKSSNSWNKSNNELSTSGYFSSSIKIKVPRVLIFHGTTCIYNNESFVKNDPNIISIGRYMTERNPLVSGQNFDERQVLYCSGLVDEVWVPSKWHLHIFKQILESFGIYHHSIVVIPEVVDIQLFDPNLYNTSCYYNENDMFKFLSIFKWEYRKGWDLLLSAYWNAFKVSDKVELIIRSYVPAWSPDSKHLKNITYIIEQYAKKQFNKSLNELPSVIWDGAEKFSLTLDDVSITREQLRDKLSSVNCFVLPTRGEGWGLPIAEAMAMELPVIVTNCTGTTEYLTDENSYPIPTLGFDEEGYSKPDINVLISHMKQVVLDSSNGIARKKGIAARETMKFLSPEYVTSLMAERVKYHALRRGWKI
jgi:glycosyltransferase involved in cell wall biosynthesis